MSQAGATEKAGEEESYNHMENHGIILEDRHPGDYVYGSTISAPTTRTVIDWTPYLPDGEPQKTTASDMLCCTTMSATHSSIEAQVNYDMAKGNYRQEALDYFKSAGYLENGKFRTSVRYNAVMNGTTKDGQYMSKAADGIRHDGLLPYADMPMTPNMTWEEFYTPPTPEQITKAKKIYQYLDAEYHWVDPYNIPTALYNAPVQVATSVCDGWSTSPVVAMCGGACQHCTMVYKEDANGNYMILDHYEPYLKKLASNYHIFAAMQYVVNPQIPPTLFSKVLDIIKKAYNVK